MTLIKRSLTLLVSLSLAACGGGSAAPRIDATAPDTLPACTATQSACGGRCVDLMTDRENCGSCGNACPAAQVCVSAMCVVACPTGEIACNGLCVNPQTDPSNCGGCAGASRTDGGSSEASTADAGAAAGVVCPSGNVCSGGKCGVSCVAGEMLCSDGLCHDLMTDNGNCGACSTAGTTDKACGPGLVCTAGMCKPTCGSGLMACGTACVDTQNDPNNCGGCGKVCTSAVCSSGACVDVAAPISFISPGGTATAGAHARPLDFTLASQGPATIYYTTDGSTPTPGGATTTSAASPVTLTSIGSTGTGAPTNIQWYADYGGIVGPELVVHSYQATSPGPGNNLGSLVDHVKFTGPGGPVIVVAPGTTVAGTVDYQVWRSNGSGYCPGCVIEWVVGVDGVGQVGCFVYGGGTYPGQSGTQSFSFKAPTKPGRYPMRQGLSLQFTCAAAGYPGGEEVGELIVK